MNELSKPSSAAVRRGVTLIELLIVLAMILVLAAVSLPAIKNTMKDHRTTEAARLVQGFLESCRAKAIASNRPVAAIFERVGVTNADTVGLATCTRMSMGEVFPPYEGDWANATGNLGDTNSDGFVDFIEIPLAQASVLSSILTVGDTIQIGEGDHRFPVTAISTPTGPPRVKVEFENPIKVGTQAIEESRWPTQAGTTNVTFKAFRKPSKSMSGSVLLPRGTCVDLAWSGFGKTGVQLSTSVAPWAGYRNIYVVFNARGAVETVYEFQRNTAGATNIPALSIPVGQLHFLVGKFDQVDTSLTPVSTRDEFLPNLLDMSNKWITLNTYNGLVHTSDMAPVIAATPVESARDLATRHATAKD